MRSPPAREVLPGVLSRIQDAPLAGQRHTGTAVRAPAGTRSRVRHTASWRTSPPLRTTRSLNVAVLPRRNSNPGTGVSILASRYDKTSLVRQSQCGPLVL